MDDMNFSSISGNGWRLNDRPHAATEGSGMRRTSTTVVPPSDATVQCTRSRRNVGQGRPGERHGGVLRRLAWRVGVYILLVSVPFAVPTAVRGHTELTHGILTMLAYNHLLTRADAGDAEAKETIDFFDTYFTSLESHAEADPVTKILLGIDPLATLSGNAAPLRKEPGLSEGPEDPKVSHLPEAPGALLGFLVETVDEHLDIWGTAIHPYHPALQSIDEALDDKATEWCDGAGGVCDLLGIFVSLFLDLINLDENIAEDFVGGCDQNDNQDTVVDQLIEDEDATEEQEAALRDDSAFYQALGISFDACDSMEEGLEDITNLTVPGNPANIGEVILTTRARLADAILACKTVVGDLEDGVDSCLDGGSTSGLPSDPINRHMRQLEPWSLSAESVDRVVPTEPYWKRWAMGHPFTTLSHFMDLLSPAGSSKIDFVNAGINVMMNDIGLVHSFDGYSLGEGKRFILNSTPGWGTDTDDLIREKASDFELYATEGAIGYFTLRRRVCFDGQQGDASLAGLQTSDGLGISVCGDAAEGATPAGYATAVLPNDISPPSDIGILDGFSLWTSRTLPKSLSYTGPEVLGFSQLRSYTPYNATFAFALRADDYGSTLGQGLFQCDNPVDCAGNADRYVDLLTVISNPASEGFQMALGLRGLALAIHLAQDLTVPHHIAPTTAFGHESFEGWFSSWVWPRAEGEDSYSGRVSVQDWICTTPAGNPAGEPICDTCVISGHDCEGDECLIPSYWGPLAEESRGATNSLYEAVVGAMGTSGFAASVDAELTRLSQDMDALATPSCAAGKFAARRLARAVAFRTAKRVALLSQQTRTPLERCGDRPQFSLELVPEGFWHASVQTVKHPESIYADENQGTAGPRVGNSLWREYAKQALPTAVAATVHVLKAAAKVAKAFNPRAVSCDAGSASGPLPDGATVDVAEVSCTAAAFDEISQCLQDPSDDACAAFAPYPSYGECASSPYSTSGPNCLVMAIELASCLCKVSGTAAVASCLAQAHQSEAIAVKDLFDAGQIDRVTRYSLTGEIVLRDGDRDGIPDTVDRCPGSRGLSGRQFGTSGLSVDVCWLRDQERGGCQYGCAKTANVPVARREGR